MKTTTNPFPRNPAEVLTIQDELMDLPEGGLFTEAIRLGAKSNLNGTLRMIREQAKSNRPYMVEIIGEKLLKEIEQL